MGGILSGIGTLLGGFNTQRRIDQEGFDFREQQKQKEFERQRTQDVAGQQDEDRAANIGRDIFLGAEPGEEPDLAGLIPGDVDQARTAARVRGLVAQSRPGLEQLKGLNRESLEREKALARLGAIGAGGEQDRLTDEARSSDRQEELRLKERLRVEGGLSPTDQAKLAAINRRIDKMGGAFGGLGRLFRANTTNAAGEEVTDFVDEGRARRIASGEEPPLPRTSTAVATKREAARNSINLGTRLIGELEKDENVERIGAVFGRFNNFAEALGEGDPTAKAISGEIKSWSALQPAIHGFRSHQFTQDIEDVLNTSQNVETLIAGLKGVMAASFEVANQERPEGFDIFSGGPNVESLADSIVQSGGDPEDIQRLIDALEGQ